MIMTRSTLFVIKSKSSYFDSFRYEAAKLEGLADIPNIVFLDIIDCFGVIESLLDRKTYSSDTPATFVVDAHEAYFLDEVYKVRKLTVFIIFLWN